MAVNLRQRAEADLGTSLEKDWGLPVVLISPDGEIIDTSENSGEALTGQVLYDTVTTNPETGESVIVNNPIVTLRRSSLSRVPAPTERWIVKIPITPDPDADLVEFVLSSVRSPEGGRSIGFIKLFLQKAKQTP